MYWPHFKKCEVPEPGFEPGHVSLQSPKTAGTVPLAPSMPGQQWEVQAQTWAVVHWRWPFLLFASQRI